MVNEGTIGLRSLARVRIAAGILMGWVIVAAQGGPACAQPLLAILDDKPGEPMVIVRDGPEEARVRISLFTEEERIELARSMEQAFKAVPQEKRKHVRQLFQKRFGPHIPKFSTESVAPADYKSAGILLHTDLPTAEAQALLKKLNAVLSNATRYWGRKAPRPLECFVVRDLARWAETKFPPEAIAKLQRREGVTVVQQQQRTWMEGKQKKVEVLTHSVSYSSDRAGVPEHELVHNYCAQAFGSTGPFWYAEGMAEVGNYMQLGDPAVRVPYVVLHHLRTSKPLPLARLIDPKTKDDSWQAYARSWALCHMLNYNPNYNTRFRGLGKGLLGGQRTTFADVFGSQQAQIEFEYRFFLKHVVPGFRADLCHWDWGSFVRPERTNDKGIIDSTIEARRGWQSSGAALTVGRPYYYQASGQWQVKRTGPQWTAAGGKDGRGKLQGVILSGMTPGQPFDLGAKGKFTAPADGNLYLRCRDDWSGLADNAGSVQVKISDAQLPP